MLMIVSQSMVQLFALRIGQENRTRDFYQAIPNVLNELNALGHAQLEYIGDRHLSHGGKVADVFRGNKFGRYDYFAG